MMGAAATTKQPITRKKATKASQVQIKPSKSSLLLAEKQAKVFIDTSIQTDEPVKSIEELNN